MYTVRARNKTKKRIKLTNKAKQNKQKGENSFFWGREGMIDDDRLYLIFLKVCGQWIYWYPMIPFCVKCVPMMACVYWSDHIDIWRFLQVDVYIVVCCLIGSDIVNLLFFFVKKPPEFGVSLSVNHHPTSIRDHTDGRCKISVQDENMFLQLCFVGLHT